jgi:DnaK suppressor protein
MLTQDQIKYFERKIIEEKERLEKDLAQFAKKKKGVDADFDAKFPNYGKEDFGDTDEMQDAIEEFDAAIGIEDELENRLREVILALEAIKQGRYGVCQNCGEEIPTARLEANAAALKCVRCHTNSKQ